jgi:hypothetical protein
MAAMQTFLADYEQGKAEGRYVAGEVPYLPFKYGSFDLALCSHFLFGSAAFFLATQAHEQAPLQMPEQSELQSKFVKS